MRFSDLRHDKGVAGLTILLSLITMLFVIGLLVMIFSLMGAEMRDATYTETTVTVSSEATFINATGGNRPDTVGVRGFRGAVLTGLWNSTATWELGNATINASGHFANLTTFSFDDASVRVNYTYVWDADNSATKVMNDTVDGISNVTDWYPIFIVIGAMVVLILLTVIIITAIRGSGLIAGGTPTGRANVGSA